MTTPSAPEVAALPHPRAAREAKGFSIRELARIAELGKTTVERCERAGEFPRQPRPRRRYLAALGLIEPSNVHRPSPNAGGTVETDAQASSATSPDAPQVPA